MLDRLYLIKLIDQLRNFEGSEEDEDVFLEKLENLSAQIIALQEQAISLTIDYRKK